VLREVNRIRTRLGADPLYELPKGRPALEPGSTCVLEHAFADLGIASIEYRWARGKHVCIEHGLGGFIRDFDAGRYPELLAAAPARQKSALCG
jgi:hypothetical protein